MPDFEITFQSVKQMTYGSTTCKVQILFQVTGPKTGIDLVQVYALNPAPTNPGGLGDVVDTVDLTITESQYNSLIDLQSGAVYTLALCPRSETDGSLDDKVEGESWESFCVYQPFVTNVGNNALNPQITVDSREPATLLHSNQITISWSSSSYTDGQVLWGPVTSPEQNVYSFKPGHRGLNVDYTGQYTAPIPRNLAGQTILFTVQVRNSFQDSSLWYPTRVAVQSAHNYNSLRQFLTASNVVLPTGVRQHLRGAGSLRAIMQI